MENESFSSHAIIYSDDCNFDDISHKFPGLNVKKDDIIVTSSQAINQISPVLILEKDNSFIYPKVKVGNEQINQSIQGHSIIDVEKDMKIIKNKFDDKAYIFSEDENDKNANIEQAEQEHSRRIKILEPSDDEDPRKNIDRYNLFKGFIFAYDPFGTRSKIEDEDDVDSFKVDFENLESRLYEMFDLKIK